jgi:hypothetical protein
VVNVFSPVNVFIVNSHRSILRTEVALSFVKPQPSAALAIVSAFFFAFTFYYFFSWCCGFLYVF